MPPAAPSADGRLALRTIQIPTAPAAFHSLLDRVYRSSRGWYQPRSRHARHPLSRGDPWNRQTYSRREVLDHAQDSPRTPTVLLPRATPATNTAGIARLQDRPPAAVATAVFLPAAN